MRIATSFLALAALIAAVPACSSSPPSGSGAPSGNFDPGVSTSKLVDDMSDAEVTTFCNAGREYTGGVIARLDPMQFACNLQGSFAAMGATTDAEAQSACKSAKDDCVASYKPRATTTKPGSDAKPCDANDDASLRKQCAGKGVTVGEVAACSQETTGALNALASTSYCSAVNVGASSAQNLNGGPACSALLTKCPAAFTASSSTGVPSGTGVSP